MLNSNSILLQIFYCTNSFINIYEIFLKIGTW